MLELSIDDVQLYLNTRTAKGQEPSQTLRNIVKWIQVDTDSRREHFGCLVNMVSLCQIEAGELQQIVESDADLFDSDECRTMVQEALDYHKQPMYRQVLSVDKHSSLMAMSPPNVVILGKKKEVGAAGDFDAGYYMLFVEEDSTSSACYPMPVEPKQLSFRISVVNVNNYMMVCNQESPECYLFDPCFLQWQQIASFPIHAYKDYKLIVQGTA